MAATLTDELTRVSVADIEKWDEGPDGTVYVYGRCTTPDVDTDDQVVASEWSGPALKEYLATAPTVRVQHNAQRDPAGSAVRVDVNRDGDGAHWLKAAVDEPIAQRLVKRGHLRAFSVGIARPVIERDLSGKARGGIIKGGKIVEVSLVDSPANRSCFLEIAKSAADGTCEFTGKVGGSEDVLAKALGGDLLTKEAPAGDDLVNVDLPPGASISISPADFARLHTFKQQLVTKAAGTGDREDAALKAVLDAETAVYKRDIDTPTRRRLASQGRALPNLSYPVENHGDADNAATLALSGHGDVAAAKRMLRRIADEEGWADIIDRLDGKSGGNAGKGARVPNPLDESDGGDSVAKSAGFTDEQAAIALGALQDVMLAAPLTEKAAGAPAGQQEATPDVTKDPDPRPVKKAKKKPKGPKKMPPWLKGDDDADAKDGDSKDDDDSSCKSVSDHLWTGIEGTSTIECSKCHTTPAAAAGVTAAAMNPAPVKELQESTLPAALKSGPTPASASGATAEHMEPVPRHREPDGAPMEAMERTARLSDGDDEKPTGLEAATGMKYAADMAPDPEVAALLRFKAVGTPEDLGRLHDLTCPAFHPEMAAKYHPYADMGTLIDSGAWQRKTLHAAAGPLKGAMEMQEMWQAALLLKTADPGDLNDWRLELHKAFRDANPGPGTYPTPGCVSPQRYSRPVLTAGRASNAVDYGMPNSSPQVATTPPDANSFDRPPLSAGHQSPSPSHMKWDSGQYPPETGVPTQLTYAQMQKEHQRMALVRMHDHLGRQFPEVCPLNTVAADGTESRPLRGAQPEHHAVPVPAGIGKAGHLDAAVAAFNEAAATGAAVPFATGIALPPATKAMPEQEAGLFADAEVYKSFKKMRKKLGKKILSGKMTVDEARAYLGRQFAQKGGEAAPEVAKGFLPRPAAGIHGQIWGDGTAHSSALQPVPVDMPAPEVLKAAIAEALAEAWKPVPLEAAQIGSFDPSPAIEAAVTKALAPFAEQFTTRLAETQRVIDAIADQPDPSTATFSGLAFQPQIVKSGRPAAVPDQAEYAARAQAMVRRNLTHTYQTHSDPYVREAAAKSLASMGVGTPADAPMT